MNSGIDVKVDSNGTNEHVVTIRIYGNVTEVPSSTLAHINTALVKSAYGDVLKDFNTASQYRKSIIANNLYIKLDNQQKVASVLGISQPTVYRLLAKYNRDNQSNDV